MPIQEEDLYQRIFELLGISRESPIWLRFLEDIAESPRVSGTPPNYVFKQSGFVLICNRQSVFGAIVLMAGNDMLPYGRFIGDLPFGIDHRDPRQRVEEKLNLEVFDSELDEETAEMTQQMQGPHQECSYIISKSPLVLMQPHYDPYGQMVWLIVVRQLGHQTERQLVHRIQ